MTKAFFLMAAMSATLAFAAPAMASTGDHGGFGRNLFTNHAPAGLTDPIAYNDNMDAAATVANNIEPASGDASHSSHNTDKAR